MVLGFARWAGKGKEFGKKVLKDKTKTISSVPPLKKIKGAMSVSDVKNKVIHKKNIDSINAAGDQITRTLRKSTKELNKLNETLKKQKKILDK